MIIQLTVHDAILIGQAFAHLAFAYEKMRAGSLRGIAHNLGAEVDCVSIEESAFFETLIADYFGEHPEFNPNVSAEDKLIFDALWDSMYSTMQRLCHEHDLMILERAEKS